MAPYSDSGPPSREEMSQNALDPVIERWHERFGQRWGHAWLEWKPPQVNVGIVRPSADEVSALAREAREAGWTANVVSVRYSAADLERLIERIMPILERSDSMLFVGPEPRVNGVHIALNKDDVELVGELLEALPDGTLVLSIMPGASFQFAAGG